MPRLSLLLASTLLAFTSGSLPAVEPPVVKRFLSAYCIDCHNAEEQNGERRFDDLVLPVKDADGLMILKDILDQVNLGAMPPEDAEQPLPPKVQDEQLEPTVTIRDEEGKRIEEYSRAGQVYMVKVIPEKGIPYYYIDTDGDGRLETAPTKDLEQVRPVYWKVKEWD